MKKCFVLDTNVLLHNPEALTVFEDNDVVIPITVIEELDQFKRSHNKQGVHAREILRKIDQLINKGLLGQGCPLNKGTLRVVVGPTKEPLSFEPNNNDNRIIGVAYELKEQYRHVVFVSKDTNARIKAASLGLPVMDFEKQKVDYDRLYTGWTTHDLEPTEFNLFAKNHALPPLSACLPNEHVLVRLMGTEKSSLIGYYDPIQQKLLQLLGDQAAMGVSPLNMEQHFAFNLLLNPDVKLVTLIGKAGTGKTLLAVACGLEQVIEKRKEYAKLLIARPVIPLGKDIGYLPGTKEEKLLTWMQPIFDNLSYIFSESVGGKSDQAQYRNVDYLMQTGQVEIEALTYIRGRSIPNQYIIIDEAQNLTPHEVKTIISRAGENTKIVLTGDPDQIDNPYLDANSNGLTYTAERFKGEAIAGHIFLSKSERSELASRASTLL